MQDIPQLVLDLAYGAAIGAALGLTGAGGSILTVPALVYLLRRTRQARRGDCKILSLREVERVGKVAHGLTAIGGKRLVAGSQPL